MLTTSQRENWKQWLVNDRHISLRVAQEAGLRTSDSRLIIPIRDATGTVIFNKYRRSPWTENGPKYTYDTGARAALFGAEYLTNKKDVIITEGELDALALRSLDLFAVSTTGGAGTFNPTWGTLFENKNVTILYDADRAGVVGAVRVATIIPHAKIAWIPVAYGKDATEVIHNDGLHMLRYALENAKHYTLPNPESAINARVKQWNDLLFELQVERRNIMNDPGRSPLTIDFFLEWVEGEKSKDKKQASANTMMNRFQAKDDVMKARLFPIREIVKVNSAGFAHCPYHDDKTASMKVYADNHAYSYCCAKRSDSIAIYQQVHGCDFKTALKALSA